LIADRSAKKRKKNPMTKHWTVLVPASLATLLTIVAPASVARADIFEWEYINLGDPSQGKQESTMLAPDGAGANAVPIADLSFRILTMAYLIAADLSGATMIATNLTNAELSQANLTNAYFGYYFDDFSNYPGADLTGANFTNAEVRGAGFRLSNLTTAQLYSTASYQGHDLTGIDLYGNDFAGVNLAGQNLTNASFEHATLTNANLSQANLTSAKANGANLTGANLSQANLTNASFDYANLTGANLAGAEVRGASFYRDFASGVGGLTPAQLYSTASYQAHDLTGINLIDNNLAGVNLAGQNLTNAYFGYYLDELDYGYGADLTGANLSHSNLINARFDDATLDNANLSQTNLTNAGFSGARLDGANLTGAEVRGANFNRYNGVGGISRTQLYSTASYQAHDLTGIGLGSNNLVGVDLVGQNLTGAGFYYATLTGADFTGAEVRGAKFYRDIYGGTGITATQLYSTASYQAHDLSGITLYGNDLAGVNLAGQNLTDAGFPGARLPNANFSQANLTNANFSPSFDYVSSDLTGANLSQANLTNANFTGVEICGELECQVVPGANLTGANLSGADARGANFQYATLFGANTGNLIQSNGHIAGLDLTAGASLVVRDYDGNPGGYLWYPYPSNGPLPIVVDQHLAMDTTGTLRLVFDADPWDSTISFAAGIPVTLGGTLDLTFAPGVDVATQSGRTIDLFDWTGVTPTGVFTISSPYTWNLSQLYTTGEVTLAAVPTLPGDYNNNGIVDAADYTVWRDRLGQSVTLANENPAAASPGLVDAEDYAFWTANFGNVLPDLGAGSGAAHVAPGDSPGANYAVPEPASVVLLTFAAASVALRTRRRPIGATD
jgi:uncharacterized protein YjbI with pentapeptide repeats